MYFAYKHIIASSPKVLLHPGIYGIGLFSGEDIKTKCFVMEYTGNCVVGKKCKRIHRALNRLDMTPDIFVAVRNGKETVNPRGCDNSAMCINYSCDPNAVLFEMYIWSKTVVFIKALKAIVAGKEIT